MDELNNIVSHCLQEYIGGTPFFEELDNALRNNNKTLKLVMDKVIENEQFDYIIASGHFGLAVYEYAKKYIGEALCNRIIVINGGLRKSEYIVEFWKEYNINNKKIVFIDDSYYKGRTRSRIKKAIEKNGGNLIKTYVLYDGSSEKDEDVYSFYRYFDHFKLEE